MWMKLVYFFVDTVLPTALMDLFVPKGFAANAIQADYVLAFFLFIRGSEKYAFAHDNRRPMPSAWNGGFPKNIFCFAPF